MTTQQTPAHRTGADDPPVPAARQAGPTGLPRAAHRGQRHPRTATTARQPLPASTPVGTRHLRRPRPATRTVAVAGRRGDLAQPRLHLGRPARRHDPRLLAPAPPPGPRDRRTGRPASPRRPRQDLRRPRGMAPLLPAVLHRPDAGPTPLPLRGRPHPVASPAPTQRAHQPGTDPSPRGHLRRRRQRPPRTSTSTAKPTHRQRTGPRLGVVDLETGELRDPDEHFPRTRTPKGPRT